MSSIRREQILLLAALTLTTCAPQSSSLSSVRYENRSARFSVEVPVGWHEYPARAAVEGRRGIETDNPALQESIRYDTGANVVTIAKFGPLSPGETPEPGRPVMNPSIQVDLTPIGLLAGTPPTEILRLLTIDYSTAIPDMEVLDPIGGTSVSGLAAGYMSFRYTLTMKNGTISKAVCRKWVIPRGADLIVMNMVGPAEGRHVCEAEFRTALSTIQLAE